MLVLKLEAFMQERVKMKETAIPFLGCMAVSENDQCVHQNDQWPYHIFNGDRRSTKNTFLPFAKNICIHGVEQQLDLIYYWLIADSLNLEKSYLNMEWLERKCSDSRTCFGPVVSASPKSTRLAVFHCNHGSHFFSKMHYCFHENVL